MLEIGPAEGWNQPSLRPWQLPCDRDEAADQKVPPHRATAPQQRSVKAHITDLTFDPRLRNGLFRTIIALRQRIDDLGEELLDESFSRLPEITPQSQEDKEEGEFPCLLCISSDGVLTG